MARKSEKSSGNEKAEVKCFFVPTAFNTAVWAALLNIFPDSLSQKIFPDFDDVSGAHRDQKIARSDGFQQIVFNLIERLKIFTGSSELLNLLLKVCGGDSQAVRLSGGINFRQDDMVCHRESPGELIHQCFRSGVSMGLKNAPESFVRAFLSGLQCGPDFRRMVSVIIDDGHITDRSFVLETPVGSCEGSESSVNGLVGKVQLPGNCDGCQRVGHVVDPRHLRE